MNNNLELLLRETLREFVINQTFALRLCNDIFYT